MKCVGLIFIEKQLSLMTVVGARPIPLPVLVGAKSDSCLCRARCGCTETVRSLTILDTGAARTPGPRHQLRTLSHTPSRYFHPYLCPRPSVRPIPIDPLLRSALLLLLPAPLPPSPGYSTDPCTPRPASYPPANIPFLLLLLRALFLKIMQTGFSQLQRVLLRVCVWVGVCV